MSDWHWVQTHRISGYTDAAGRVTLNDVLGTWKHKIHVFADSSRQTPVRVNNARVRNNGQEIPVTRVNTNAFGIQLGNRNQNHTAMNLNTDRRNGPIYVTVSQHQRRPARNSRPQFHTMPGGEACLCEQCCSLAGY